MEIRLKLLNDLVKLQGDLRKIQDGLSQYSWDANGALILLSKSDFIKVAEKYLNGKLSALELEYWANIIECRDDIDFESELLKEYIFQLANPMTNGEINKSIVRAMLYFDN